MKKYDLLSSNFENMGNEEILLELIKEPLDESDRMLSQTSYVFSGETIETMGYEDNRVIHQKHLIEKLQTATEFVNSVKVISLDIKELGIKVLDFYRSALEIEKVLQNSEHLFKQEILKEDHNFQVIMRGLEMIQKMSNQFLDAAFQIDDDTCTDRIFEQKHYMIEKASQQINLACTLIAKFFQR